MPYSYLLIRTFLLLSVMVQRSLHVQTFVTFDQLKYVTPLCCHKHFDAQPRFIYTKVYYIYYIYYNNKFTWDHFTCINSQLPACFLAHSWEPRYFQERKARLVPVSGQRMASDLLCWNGFRVPATERGQWTQKRHYLVPISGLVHTVWKGEK